jgi:hypothetical protein
VFWVKNPEDTTKYLEAMKRSLLQGMLAWSSVNDPTAPLKRLKALPIIPWVVLRLRGLADPSLLPGAE